MTTGTGQLAQQATSAWPDIDRSRPPFRWPGKKSVKRSNIARSADVRQSPSEVRMRLRFWGVRGSIAKPGPATVRYGGNTSCVEVRSASGTLLILDCGTGAHGLGHALM